MSTGTSTTSTSAGIYSNRVGCIQLPLILTELDVIDDDDDDDDDEWWNRGAFGPKVGEDLLQDNYNNHKIK